MITSIILTLLSLALVPVFADMDERVGVSVTLGEVGLKASPGDLTFRAMQNMDVIAGEGEQEEEEEEDENSVGNQFVVKGHAAYSGMFQHQAALLVNTSKGYFQICGAVLLSSRHALTAAHCTVYMTGNITFDHFLAVGILNLTMGLLNPGAQIVPISHSKDHRKYSEDSPGYPNDISMLYLEEDITENDYVHFAELAKPEDGDFEDELCVISGWGYTEEGYPDSLQFGYQYIPSLHDCRLFWAVARDHGITSKQICGYYYPTSGCFGDSGGPLTCGRHVAGLVSWGISSCSGCFPAVYTRVSSYYDWIVRNMK